MIYSQRITWLVYSILLIVLIAEGVPTFTTTTTPTRRIAISFIISTPDVGFGLTDVIVVTPATGTCAAPTANTATIVRGTTTTAQVLATITFPTSGTWTVCYTEAAAAATSISIGTVQVGGPVSFTPTTHSLTDAAISMTISGVNLNGNANGDETRVVIGGSADCSTASAVDLCCAATPIKLSPQPPDVVYNPTIPYGGLFTLCYLSQGTGVSFPVGDVTVNGASAYNPTTVPVGAFTLTVSGQGLSSGLNQDRLMIATGTCVQANAVVFSDNLVVDPNNAANIIYTGTISTPGTYRVCYRVVALLPATTYYTLSQTLTISGATSYTKTAASGTGAGVGEIVITFTGVNLDSTAVGDSARLVKGTDCVSGTAVLTSGTPGAPQFEPTNVASQTTLLLRVTLTEGGSFTLCYKSSQAGEYVPLSPLFEVAGAASYFPTVVPQGFVGDLTVDGALLNTNDLVSIVPAGQTCTATTATRLLWSPQTTARGLATITSATTLATSGSYRVCFTPFGGQQYMLTEPLLVSGASSISPTTLIAGVTEVITVTGTNIGTTDLMKLIQSGDTCSNVIPGHGTVVRLASAGQFSVIVPYGGLFTMCYSLGGTSAYAASATIIVRGLRRLSPFTPVIVATGASVTFELEGQSLSAFDTLKFVANTATGCAGASVVPVPPLRSLSANLVTLTNNILFSSGGEFLTCYTVAGGPSLGQNPLLTVKGPVSYTPTTVNFGIPATITFTGMVLSDRDELKLVTLGNGCTDPTVTAQDFTTAGSITWTPAVGGQFSVCYKQFEGDYVSLPDPLFIAGPTTVTPVLINVNVNSVFTITGWGLTTLQDRLKLVTLAAGCAGAASFTSEQVLSATNTITVNATDVGSYLLCYQLQNATAFAQVQQISVQGIRTYTPSSLEVSYNASLTFSGMGLDPLVNRVAIQISGDCTTLTAPVATQASNLVGSNTTLIYSNEFLVGGTNIAVCFWINNAWIRLLPLLTVVGPATRTRLAANTPLVAGARIEFSIQGQGLQANFDRIRWVKAPFAAVQNANTCSFPAIADQQVLADTPNVKTPVVQLPGGTYLMCYSVGPTGVFIPVGTPLNSAGTGVTGQVLLQGPSGYWVLTPSTGNPTIGQEVQLNFDNTASTTASIRLCNAGDSTQFIPLDSLTTTVSGDTYTDIAGSSNIVYTNVFIPLRGGTPNVCILMDGGSYYPLPQTTQGAVYDPTTAIAAAGVLSIDGPSSFGPPNGINTWVLESGIRQYDFVIAGVNLSSSINSYRWVPRAAGCTSSLWTKKGTANRNSLSTETLVSPTQFRTIFHIAGEFTLCFTYAQDNDVVSELGFRSVTTTGYWTESDVIIPFGLTTATVEVPVNNTPLANVYFWFRGGALNNIGTEICPALVASDPFSRTGNLLGVSSVAASYNASHLPSGYYSICYPTALLGSVALPYQVLVRGPVSFSPSSAISPGAFDITFTGINITDFDIVRIVPPGQDCTIAASVAVERRPTNGVIRTQNFATPAWFAVCYQVNFPGEASSPFTVLPTAFTVTGDVSEIRVGVSFPLPTTIQSMTPFLITARLSDGTGAVVSESGGTMTLSTNDSPGIPIPVNGGLSRTVQNGIVNFTASLGTAGAHRLLLTYTRGSTSLTVLSNTITVLTGPASGIAMTISNTVITAGAAFTANYQIVDAGFNALSVAGSSVQISVSPTNTLAQAGTLSGTTTGVTDANGAGTFTNLIIDRSGSYRLQLQATNGTAAASTSTLRARDIDITVASGAGTSLVLTLQWPVGHSVTAGTPLTVAAQARDSGGNVLFVGTPTPFFVRIHTAPAPPAGGVLYMGNAADCISSACTVMTGGVQTNLGTATFNNLWLGQAGTYALEVSAPLLTAITNTLTVTVGPANHLLILENSLQVNANQLFAISAAVRDLGGNIITTQTNVAVTCASVTTPTALTGVLQQLTSSGVAIFTDLTYTSAGTFIIRCTHSTLSYTADSQPIYVGSSANLVGTYQQYVALHLNVAPSAFDAARAQTDAAGVAGVQAQNVRVVSSAASGNGTVAYFQLTGVQDPSTTTTAFYNRVATDTAVQSSFQGGSFVAVPQILNAVPAVTTAPAATSSGSGLSNTEIALIVIGTLIGVIILVALLYYFCRDKPEQEEPQPKDMQPTWDPPQQSYPTAGNPEWANSKAVQDNPLNQFPVAAAPTVIKTPLDGFGGSQVAGKSIQTPGMGDGQAITVQDTGSPPKVENYNVNDIDNLYNQSSNGMGNNYLNQDRMNDVAIVEDFQTPNEPYYSNAPNGYFSPASNRI